MGVDADANRVRTAIHIAEALEYGNVVYVDAHSEVHAGYYLIEVDTVRCEKDLLRGETRQQAQLHLVDADTVEQAAEALDIFKDVDVGECLAGVEELGRVCLKGIGKFVVAFGYLFGMVHVDGCTEFIGNSNKLFIC
jgi:hypothetical protein